ncbi:hypothetical protein EDB84DRAFT_1199086 [Lactarius hengduanensis]|nr:hypothetical protein EDB84DRAFT_1199086 [Lactarius hengduanensis]
MCFHCACEMIVRGSPSVARLLLETRIVYIVCLHSLWSIFSLVCTPSLVSQLLSTSQSFCDVQLAGAQPPLRVSRRVCPPSGPQLEQSEAQSLIPFSSARHTTTLPRASSSTTSPRHGSPRRCSRTTPRGKPCGPTSRPAIPTNIQPKGQPNGSTIGVTYDTANDPDCCKLLFQPRCPIRG